jgi:hypothetical protein
LTHVDSNIALDPSAGGTAAPHSRPAGNDAADFANVPHTRRTVAGDLVEIVRELRQCRDLVQQQFRGRIAELTGRAGDDDLAHETLPLPRS